ncbi:MAG: M20/M25/M40 family metallo-hydrolase [Chloroflexi bacterium]|nr:M20/M25/M40 family metallo-hydrolase [Chloroflexota bacterium]
MSTVHSGGKTGSAEMEFDWNAIGQEALDYFRSLLRLDTTNPPGNEIRAAEFLAGVLQKNGIESIILESEQGRGSVVARLQGTGEAAPLLLMGHTDVVPAEPDKWTHQPFAADVDRGYIYGRGAVDMKNMVTMELMVFLLLKRMGINLRRDIIYAATADEETGGRKGIGFLARNHPELIQAEYAINEGGGFPIAFGDNLFYTCQTAEKGVARFVMRARGKPGHASIPHGDNAVVHLAGAILKLGQAKLPFHLTSTVRVFWERMMQAQTGELQRTMHLVIDPATHAEALDRLPLSESLKMELRAMMHNTTTPTMLKAGSKINVIPGEAEVQVDARILPGVTFDAFEQEIRQAVGPEVEVVFTDQRMGFESDFDTPLFHHIQSVMASRVPGSQVIPYMVVGGTDARHVIPLGTRVYGFAPMRHIPGEEVTMLAHGHDERIPAEDIVFGTRILFEIISSFH